MPDATVNYGFEIPKADGSDLNEPNRWRNPITAIDTKLKQIDQQSNPVVQLYNPAWASSGAAPAIGNGSLMGRYIQIGKLVVFDIFFAPGSTTTFGTGNYTFSLPIAADMNSNVRNLGNVLAINNGNYYTDGTLLRVTNNTFQVLLPASNTASNIVTVTNAVPWALKSGDTYDIHGWYEAA